MSLRKSINYIARKILYQWVKTEIIPTNIKQLDINSDIPAIYVLETRSWSNLLMLEQQCELLGLPDPLNRISSDELAAWHSVYTIAPKWYLCF